MGRLLTLLFWGVLAYLLIRAFRRSGRKSAPGPAGSSSSEQTMVPCAHCGICLPQTEALAADDRFYCSEEHRRLAGGR